MFIKTVYRLIILSFLLCLNPPESAATGIFFSDQTENVGIGTIVPSSKVDVVGTVKATSFSGDASGLTNVPAGGLPSGVIMFIDSGTCPAGWTEVTAFNGKTIFGTLAANSDVGGTGGSDTITPAGTNGALTFTGTALGTHFHGAGTYAADSSTGASKRGTTNDTLTQSHGHTISGSSEAKTAGTPEGTVNTPSFTGTQFDNRSAYVKLIACKKD
jgi:hypothetical protein